MKRAKKIMLLALSFTFLLCCTMLFASAAGGITEFGVTADIGDAQVQINWWNEGKNYYLFLPSDVDAESLRVTYTASGAVTINGVAVSDGCAVALTPASEYTLACDGNSYKLTVLQSANVPSMHITTESGSMDAVHADKSHKEAAALTLLSDGEVILDKELEYIKGRGNATWTFDKKPYNIKFDKKTDMFGMGKAKKWSLLANYLDDSLMRNHIALNLAENVGIPYTSKHVFVDLYVDNEYYGNYLLCESVEIGETRVDINDLEGDTEDANTADLDAYDLGGAQISDYKKLVAGTQKWVNIPNNPDDISGGYLLEYELPNRYVNEVSGFVTNRNQTIVVKGPEYASEAQVKYISALYQDFEDAVYSETGYNSLGKHYTEYIDVDSFIKMYVFQEYVKNLDAGLTSFYICKDNKSDLFVAAPVWDFDNSLGNSYSRYGMNTKTPDGWWAGIIYHFTENSIKSLPTILNALYKQDDFFALATTKWQTVFSPIISDTYIAELEAFIGNMKSACVMDAVRWATFSTKTYAATEKEYDEYIESVLLPFITKRKVFLDKGLSDASVRVFYNANGGTGNMFNESVLFVGDILTLPKNNFTHSTLVFDGWNTAADGSGISYNEGDSIPLTGTSITLYAQWREKTLDDLNFFGKILAFFTNLFERIRNFFESLFG